MYEKYAFIAAGIVAYRDAAPVSGNVPPIVIVRAVIPVSDEADVALDAETPSATDERRGQEHDLPHSDSFWRWCGVEREPNRPLTDLPLMRRALGRPG